jgi:dephospho-CoA kinase
LIVGLTGPNAAGKGEAARYLQEIGFTVHSLSDVVREEAARLGLPPEREHLIRIGNELRRQGGPGILAERLLPRIGHRDAVDSIRNPAEVAVLRRIRAFRLLGVTAPVELRFRRSLARGRPGDPRTLEEFQERERQENDPKPENQQLDATLRLADRVLSNDGDLDRLRAGVERILADWIAASETASVRPD